jgi:hypothetical protein
MEPNTAVRKQSSNFTSTYAPGIRVFGIIDEKVIPKDPASSFHNTDHFACEPLFHIRVENGREDRKLDNELETIIIEGQL